MSRWTVLQRAFFFLDIVFKYLDDYQIQVDMDMFRHMGFHYFEVKCACFVLASSPQPSKLFQMFG